MTTVIPGQYLVPQYETRGTGADERVVRHIPGTGAVVSQIRAGATTIPVLVATVLGTQVKQEIRPAEGTDAEESTDAKESTEDKNASKDQDSSQKPIEVLVSVVAGKNGDYARYASEIDTLAPVNATATNLPHEGDTVLVRITRLNPKQAFCEILTVYGSGNVSPDGGVGANGTTAHNSVPVGGGSQILLSFAAVAATQSFVAGSQPLDVGENFKGIIRSQDVRATDRDKVKIIDCFRPGDVVRAQVLLLGDGLNYYLTTARNDLGVVFARSEGGAGDAMVAIDWETMVCERTGVVERRKCAKVFE